MKSIGIDVGLRNLAICILDIDDDNILTVDKAINIDLFKNKRISSNQYVLCKTVIDCLSHHIIKDEDVEYRVSIEFQSPRNKRMTKVSHYIFTYFISKKFTNIKYTRATEKLNNFVDIVDYDRPKTTYIQRKKTALNDCNYYLMKNNIDMIIRSYDIADAFLYAYYNLKWI